MRRSSKQFREHALKAQQIVKSTFRVDKKNTQFVYPYKMEVTRQGYKFQTVTKIPGQRARIHKVEVRMPRGYTGKFSACDAIKIDCDCERYTFVWNYALHKHGAAIKDRTTGEPPDVTNPSESPGVCVDGNALVYTKTGSKKLRDVEVGDRVRTLAGYKPVTAKTYSGKKKTLTVKLDSGRRLSLTDDHLMLVATKDGIEWLRADKITPRHYVVCADGLETKYHEVRLPSCPTPDHHNAINPKRIPKRLTPDVAELLGLLVAEGSGKRGCGMSQYEPITRLRAETLSLKIFNRGNRNPLSLGAHVGRLVRLWGMRFGSYRIRVPKVIFNSPNEVITAFLRGYYAGDGWFSTGGKFTTAGTASPGLARDLLHLLSRIGIRARITVNRNSGAKKITMYLVRTSDYANTQRAARRFLPKRCRPLLINEERDFGMYSRVPIRSANSMLLAYCYELVDAIPVDDVPVRVRNVKDKFPGIAITARLRRAGKIRKIRDRAGGKKTNYTTLADVVSVVRDDLAMQMYSRVRIRRAGGDRIGRHKIERALSKLPDGGHCLRERMKVFFDKSVFFERVSSVERGKTLKTYDISVKDAEHFFANSMCVHNCKHGLVMLGALTKLNPVWPENRASRGENSGRVVRLATIRDVL